MNDLFTEAVLIYKRSIKDLKFKHLIYSMQTELKQIETSLKVKVYVYLNISGKKRGKKSLEKHIFHVFSNTKLHFCYIE